MILAEPFRVPLYVTETDRLGHRFRKDPEHNTVVACQCAHISIPLSFSMVIPAPFSINVTLHISEIRKKHPRLLATDTLLLTGTVSQKDPGNHREAIH